MMSFVITLVLLFAPVTLESGRFNITQKGRRIGTEEFTISARGTGYLVQGTTRLNGTTGAITSRMELDGGLNPISYEYTNGSSTIKVKVEQPVSELIINEKGKESPLDFRFPTGGFIVDNNFFHHYLLLLYKVGEKDASLPIFVPQDVRQGEAIVRSKGNRTFELIMGDVKLEATTDTGGRLIRLTVPEAGVVVER